MQLLRYVFLLGFGLCALGGRAQEEQESPQVIRVKRESPLAKVVFDNTEYRLMVVDRFGNPRENKILSYKLWIKGRQASAPLEGFNNTLTAEMIAALRKQSKAVKIFFTEIAVEDDNGHVVKLPDAVDTWFPDCVNCERGSQRRR